MNAHVGGSQKGCDLFSRLFFAQRDAVITLGRFVRSSSTGASFVLSLAAICPSKEEALLMRAPPSSSRKCKRARVARGTSRLLTRDRASPKLWTYYVHAPFFSVPSSDKYLASILVPPHSAAGAMARCNRGGVHDVIFEEAPRFRASNHVRSYPPLFPRGKKPSDPVSTGSRGKFTREYPLFTWPSKTR